MKEPLIARLVACGVIPPDDPRVTSTMIICNNLIDHFDDLDESAMTTMKPIPPFDKVFIQFEVPDPKSGEIGCAGLFVQSKRVNDPESEIGWLLNAEMWGSPNFHSVHGKEPVIDWSIDLNLDGTIREHFTSGMSDIGASYLKSMSKDKDEYENRVKAMSYLIFCGLFALSLLNCRNIVLAEAPLSHREKRNLRMSKPVYRYHILKIRRGKKLYDFYQESQGQGDKKALHMCRGHFKTFTDEAPLMGKFVGTYYWGSFMRGRDKDHVVDKDYELLESEAS